MAQDQREMTGGDQSKEMSSLEIRLTQGVIVMFLGVGVFLGYMVLTVSRQELLGGALGPREGLLTLVMGTPLRFLLPFVAFGLAGYSYVYMQNHR